MTSLILGYGNPLRSDDGFGWKMATEIEPDVTSAEVKVIATQQLTPELAEAVAGSRRILFLDAAQGTGGWPTQIVLPGIAGRVSAISYVNDNLIFAATSSGEVYREMKIGEKLAGMSEDQALDLLASNGKLIKRPFVLAGDTGLVGFKEEDWKKSLR